MINTMPAASIKSHTSISPPPPPAAGALTVRLALAPCSLAPAGAVASACAPIEAVYVPADAACNGSVMVQLPSAEMFAPLKETAVELFVSERAAPAQVVDGAGAGASVSPGGSATCRLDWVSAKPLAFAIVTVSVDAEFGATLAGEKSSVTVGGSGVTASGAGQELFGPPELDLGGTSPAIQPGWVRQVGIRSVDPGERKFVHEQQLPVFDMRSIDEMGVRRVMELALQGLTPDTHVHVSFDVDFLDPEIAPGVGTTVAGGMPYREAQLCMEMIADTGLMGSLDIMELNPALDVRNKTATLAVDLVESLFGKSTLMRLPESSRDGRERSERYAARAGFDARRAGFEAA